MPSRGQPLTEEHKAKLRSGIAAAKSRREAGDPVQPKSRRPYVRRMVSPSPHIIMSDPPLGPASAPVLSLILEELRAIRGLLDMRLPGWSMAPAMAEPQAKAAEEIVEKVRGPAGVVTTRVSRGTSAYQAERDLAVVTAVEAAERVPMPVPRPAPHAAMYNESLPRQDPPPSIVDPPAGDDIDDLGDDPAADLAAELAELSALDDLPPAPPDEESVWRPRLEMYKYGMWVENEWGSPPGRSGCLAPDWLLEDMGLAQAAAR